MKSTIAATRAVGVEFVLRKLKPLIVIGIVVSVALLALGGYLTTRSAWWWFLEAAFIILSLVFVVLLIVVRAIIGIANPNQDKSQRKLVRNFVDKLERATEHVETSPYVIVFRIILDLRKKREDTFIGEVVHDSKTLTPDFNDLRKSFDNN